jgi:DNA-binding response OmpR family regulator
MMAVSPSDRRQKVLLIDDDELIADSSLQYLTTNGCEVGVALDAASAKVLNRICSSPG